MPTHFLSPTCCKSWVWSPRDFVPFEKIFYLIIETGRLHQNCYWVIHWYHNEPIQHEEFRKFASPVRVVSLQITTRAPGSSCTLLHTIINNQNVRGMPHNFIFTFSVFGVYNLVNTTRFSLKSHYKLDRDHKNVKKLIFSHLFCSLYSCSTNIWT